MRSGVYTKMLKSYYAKQTSSTDKTNSSGKNSSSKDYLNTINDKISKLKTSTSDEALSNIKSEADQMKKAADAVTAIDYDKTSSDAVYSKVKDLVNTYNSLAKQTGKSDLVSISQSRTWMVNDTKAHEAQWNKIGITMEDDQTLTIDEKKFKELDKRYQELSQWSIRICFPVIDESKWILPAGIQSADIEFRNVTV